VCLSDAAASAGRESAGAFAVNKCRL
jgi:hypothetical protein